METLKRSRSHRTVVTANGEVQTNEEAQVYVHDLHIFVTVQLLEDTLAVLSLGKLCNEHGYTYDWPIGREPRLTQNEIQTLCNSGNFVPLVGSGHSSSSTTASSSTSPRETVAKGLRETARRKVFPNGWRTSQRTSRSQKNLRPQTFLMTQIWNEVAPRKHSNFLLASQKTKIARSAREPRFRGLLADGELEKQRSLVI